jgi:ribonuclease HII
MKGQREFFTKQTEPDFSFEEKFDGPVAGLDEVGRGPLAGPVIAAAVILDPEKIPEGLNDSKKLTRGKREDLFILINSTGLVGIGEASVEEIDDINILEASMLAMRRALENLPSDPVACLVDGNRDPGLPFPTRCLIKGDALSFSIAAASIIAKVFRDKIMSELSKTHPEYGWAQIAGYGVPHH